MRIYYQVVSFILLFWACNGSADPGSTTEDSQKTHPSESQGNTLDFTGSYTYEQNGDTVAMHLNVQGDSVIGQLVYALKEKDVNFGNFKGVVKDSILIAVYDFESERRHSTRDIAFKLNGMSAVEGYGEVLQVDGGFRFKDPTNLTFGDGIVLKRDDD